MGSTKDAILSAKKIFLTKPTVNKKIPNFIFEFENIIFFFLR